MRRLFMLAFLLATQVSCADFSCAFGGPGCGTPVEVGLCNGALAVGQEYLVVFGYHTDTSLLGGASVESVTSKDTDVVEVRIPDPDEWDVPRDERGRPESIFEGVEPDGAILIKAKSAGNAKLFVQLEGWDRRHKMKLVAVDPPAGYDALTPQEWLNSCFESPYRPGAVVVDLIEETSTRGEEDAER